MRKRIRLLGRRHQNPRSFWTTLFALAILTWGLWYHDLTMIGVGIAGAVIGTVAFREPKRFTSFGARAAAWQVLALRSKRHTFLTIVALVPILWGLWQNHTAWTSFGLLGVLLVTWHFNVTRFMPRDAGRVILVDDEIVPRRIVAKEAAAQVPEPAMAESPAISADGKGEAAQPAAVPVDGVVTVDELTEADGDDVPVGEDERDEGDDGAAVAEDGVSEQEETIRRKVRKKRKRKKRR